MKEILKSEVEGMSYKDITNLLLEKNEKGMNTLDLFNKIIELLDLPKSTLDNKIAEYYTSLTTDKRFVLIDGVWDLRSRHTSDKVIISFNDEDEDLEELEDVNEEDDLIEDENEFDEENFDEENLDDEAYDDSEDDFGDLVIVDENELEENN